MPKILAISSQVACGHVGLSAIIPALQALQQQIIALPTILLSNHPGHPHVAGNKIEPSLLEGMLTAIEKNGWLSDIDAVLTGYCPTVGHVEFAKTAVETVQRHSPSATIICDPIIGDDAEGIYLDIAAANAIKSQLVPLADILMPNMFELGWLCGKSLTTTADIVEAAREMPSSETVVTSVPWSEGCLANLLVTHEKALAAITDIQSEVPKGTGDFFSGVFAHDRDIALATSRTEVLILASLKQPHLSIAGSASRWLQAAPSVTEVI